MIKVKKVDENLESLRGFAALIVVFQHIIYFPQLIDRNYQPSGIKAFEPPAHSAVLIFFMLSGYVIGLAQSKRLAGEEILIYLKKRFLRIYPIYLVALLFSLIMMDSKFTLQSVIAHLTFTQNIFAEPFTTNGPLWSLNYEIIYYLFFVAVSFFNIRSFTCVLSGLFIGIISLYFHTNNLIAAYAFGFSFWATGLYIARNFKTAAYSPNVLAGLLFILSMQEIWNFLNQYVKRFIEFIHLPPFGTGYWSQLELNFYEVKYLPVCFCILIYFTGKSFRFRNTILIALNLISMFSVALYYKRYGIVYNNMWVGFLYYLLALLVYKTDFKIKVFQKAIAWIGSISYGLYIIHFPILFCFEEWDTGKGSPLVFLGKTVLFLIVSITAAWLLEKWLQPFVRNMFTAPKVPAVRNISSLKQKA